MTEFDPDTGLVLSSTEDIYHDAQLGTEDTQQPPEDTQPDDPTDDKPSARPGWINKKLILTIAACLVAVIVVVGLVSPDKKSKKKTDEQMASELVAPDFYVSPVYEKEKTPAPEPIQEEPLYLTPPPEKPRQTTVSSSSPATVPVVNDGDIRANNASMIPVIQGRLLGQERATTSQNGIGDVLSSIGNSGGQMSQDQYVASRLSALAGLGGTTQSASSLPANGTTYQDQNMQGNKSSFYETGREEEAVGGFVGENTLWNGSVIPGVLITGINTDLPGDIQARVTENIYDSLTGKKLLIPQGSILIASYNASISFAQSRVQIAWNTLIRPDGYQLSLGNMNGVDAQGYSGTKGKVDEHLFQYVKAAGIISAFTIVNGEFAQAVAGTTNQSLQNLMTANQGVVNQLGANIIDRTLNIQPTLTVKSGTKINIMLNKNIQLPPLEDYPVKKAYKRK